MNLPPSKLSRDELHNLIPQLGLSITELSDKETGYGDYTGKTLLYVSNKRVSYPLAIHPSWADTLTRGIIPGVSVNPKVYLHSSNYKTFPKGITRNGKLQHRACHIDVQNYSRLHDLLQLLGNTTSYPVCTNIDSKENLDYAEINDTFEGLSQTEKEAIIKARIGQGRFREDLENFWQSQCAVTGLGIRPLLRASHIKPWRDSNNHERLDANNGLLLVATLDAAFDAGLISFEDDGTMLFSNKLGPSPKTILGIINFTHLRIVPNLNQKKYLHHHRVNVFLI